MSEIPLARSSVGDDRAPVDVRETRKKDHVIKPVARTNTVRKFDVRHPSDRPAAIPRIDRERFRQMLREYEEDRMPAAEMLYGVVRVGDETVDIGDINRFVNPRATLEAQGIPVHAAGNDDVPAPESVTVPISQEKNGGGTSASPPATSPRH